MKKILVVLAALTMSAMFSFVGAPTASANNEPSLCWNGVFLEACVSGPGWVDLNPWNNWNPGHGPWDKHHGGKHWK
jgi:hypothetical protein